VHDVLHHYSPAQGDQQQQQQQSAAANLRHRTRNIYAILSLNAWMHSTHNDDM
jgi:hypothetical protein